MTQIAIPFAKADNGREGLCGLPPSGTARLPRLLASGIALSSPSDNVRMLEAAAIYSKSKREFIQVFPSNKLGKAWTKRNNEIQRMATKNTKYIRELLPAYLVATALSVGHNTLINTFIDAGALTAAAIDALKHGKIDLGLVRAAQRKLDVEIGDHDMSGVLVEAEVMTAEEMADVRRDIEEARAKLNPSRAFLPAEEARKRLRDLVAQTRRSGEPQN